MISEEEFKAWLQDPVTRAVRQVLANKRADLRNEWEMCEPTSFANETFVAGNIANIGMCRGLAFAETLDYEVFTGELDDKRERASALGGSSVG